MSLNDHMWISAFQEGFSTFTYLLLYKYLYLYSIHCYYHVIFQHISSPKKKKKITKLVQNGPIEITTSTNLRTLEYISYITKPYRAW